MKTKPYYIAGSLLALFGVLGLVYAFSHPELSFPWENWVSYSLYALYIIYTVLIFCMPRFGCEDPAVCVILAVEFVALGLILVSIGLCGKTGSTNWYLPAGLFLSAAGNFTNALRNRKKPKQ